MLQLEFLLEKGYPLYEAEAQALALQLENGSADKIFKNLVEKYDNPNGATVTDDSLESDAPSISEETPSIIEWWDRLTKNQLRHSANNF